MVGAKQTDTKADQSRTQFRCGAHFCDHPLCVVYRTDPQSLANYFDTIDRREQAPANRGRRTHPGALPASDSRAP